MVGGGIAGIGAAAMLSRQAKVVVLEAESQCGYHATGRSAAIYIPSYGGPEICQLTADSESYLSLPNQYSNDQSFLRERGEVLVACEGEEDTMTEHLAVNSEPEEISLSEAIDYVPILNPKTIRRASIEKSARDIDTDLLLQSWIRLCRSRGGRIITGQPVSSVHQDAGIWTVETAQQTYQSPIVINAAGAWADQVAVLAGVKPVGLIPCRRSAALIPPPGNYEVSKWPLFGSVAETWYAKPMGGKLMVSPADEDPVEPHDAYAEDMTIIEGIDRYERAVTMPVDRVEHNWAGLRTFAKDKVPVVGWDAGVENFFWLAGQGGYGFQTAPALSQLVASIIFKEAGSAEISKLVDALSPRRF